MYSKEEFIENLKNGDLVYFQSSQLKSPEPHFHVCINVSENVCVFLLCGTSSPERILRYLQLRNITYETIVGVEPNPDINELKKETYFNCNDPKTHTTAELYQLYCAGQLRFRGSIESSYMEFIRRGIKVSPVLTEEEKEELLK